MQPGVLLQKMATSSSDDENGSEEALGDKICKVQKAKKEVVDCTIPFSEELTKLAQRERKYLDRLAEKQKRKKQQQVVKILNAPESDAAVTAQSEISDSSSVTQSELKNVQFENIQLRESLDQVAKQLQAQLQKIAELERSMTAAQHELDEKTKLLIKTKHELNETRQRLSDVQERLTVAEQVTAATQQRALQESDNSEQLQPELTPQQQSTEGTGLNLTFKYV